MSERNPNRRRYVAGAAVCWLVSGLGYLTVEAVVAGAFRDHYSYAYDYISDLGRRIDSPLAYLMNFAFCLQGTGFVVGALLAGRAVGSRGGLFVALATANALGNVLVGTFHTGLTAEANGTIWVHRTGAVLAIVGGNCAIVAGSAAIRKAVGARWFYGVSAGVAALGLVSLVMLAIGSTTGTTVILPAATWERGSVYSIIGWQMFAAVCLLRRPAVTGFVREVS